MEDRCSICDKRANGRKLFVPIRDPIHTGITDECICEKCYFCLPYDLQATMRSNAATQSKREKNLKTNMIVTEALRNSNRKSDFNYGYCILFVHPMLFDKYRYKRTFKEALSQYSSLDVYSTFKDGRKI